VIKADDVNMDEMVHYDLTSFGRFMHRSSLPFPCVFFQIWMVTHGRATSYDKFIQDYVYLSSLIIVKG